MARVRVPTGVEGLDQMLQGGLPQGKSYLISGEPGTGKTTFSAQFVLQGIHSGENGVFISIDEKPTHVVEDAESLGWDLRTPVEEGKLTLLDVSPYFNWVRYGRGGNMIDTNEVIQDLAKQIRRINAKRLIFDSVVPLVLHRERVHDVQEFIRNLVFSIDDNLGCTTLMTSHVWPGTLGLAGVGIEEYLVSGIIGLRLERIGNKYERRIFVRKMRSTHIDLAEHTFDIVSGRGIVIRPSVD